MEGKKTWVLQNAKNVLLMILGTFVLAFGTAVFIVPFNLVVGGVSGLALIFDGLITFEFLNVEIWIAIITWGLFFLGWILLGNAFALKTLISTIVYPIGVWLSSYLVDPNVLGGLFYLQSSPHTELALILASVAGGVMVGVGCALTFLCGGSTGGVDIIAFTICKFFKRLKSSIVIFMIDASVIVAGMLINHDLIISLLGILSALITAIVIDKIFLGGNVAFVAQIVTDYPDQINRAVIEKMERSTTILDAVGGYTLATKKMLMVSFNMRQYAQLLQIVHTHDKNAFVTIHRAHEVNGEGWTR